MVDVTLRTRGVDRNLATYRAEEDGAEITVVISAAQYAVLSRAGGREPLPRPALPAGKTWRWVKAGGGVVTFDTPDGMLDAAEFFVGSGTIPPLIGTSCGIAIPLEPGSFTRAGLRVTLSAEIETIIDRLRSLARELR